MNETVILTQENTVRPLRQGGKHLRKSFDSNGLLYELPKVRLNEETGMHEVVVGRWRVLQILFEGGYETLEAELVPWDAGQAAVANLSSNMTSTTNWQVDPWDVLHLVDQERMEQKDVADLIGCSPAKVSQLMTVFNLVPALQDKVQAGLLEGRDNILRCNRLPVKDQKTLAKEDGKITSGRIKELLDRLKVKPLEDVEDIPEYSDAYDYKLGGDNDLFEGNLVVKGAELDDLLDGQPVTVTIGDRRFQIQVLSEVEA